MFLTSGLIIKLDDIPKTIYYTVDPNCDQGIWINQPATRTHHSSRQNLPVVVRCHPIYKLLWGSQGSLGRHWFVVHRRSTFRTVEGSDWRFSMDLRHTYVFPTICELSSILNYYGSWYWKDRLEVNLFMIALFHH